MARWCSRHHRIVLVLWLVALAGSFGASRAAGTSFSNQFPLPDTQSGPALSLLAQDRPAAAAGPRGNGGSGGAAPPPGPPRPHPPAPRGGGAPRAPPPRGGGGGRQ